MAETQNEHISQLDFKLVLKQLKQSHLVHVQKSQLKVDADSELMDVVREYATVLLV